MVAHDFIGIFTQITKIRGVESISKKTGNVGLQSWLSTQNTLEILTFKAKNLRNLSFQEKNSLKS